MKIADMPKDMLESLRERGHSLAAIEKMDGATAFNEYCNWKGLIGWGPTLYSLAKHCMDE